MSLWKALQTRGWARFFAEHRIEPLRIGYEDDLEPDPDAAARAVLKRIGVATPDGWHGQPPLQRQADALSEQWVAAYHSDRAERMSDPDGAPAAR